MKLSEIQGQAEKLVETNEKNKQRIQQLNNQRGSTNIQLNNTQNKLLAAKEKLQQARTAANRQNQGDNIEGTFENSQNLNTIKRLEQEVELLREKRTILITQIENIDNELKSALSDQEQLRSSMLDEAAELQQIQSEYTTNLHTAESLQNESHSHNIQGFIQSLERNRRLAGDLRNKIYQSLGMSGTYEDDSSGTSGGSNTYGAKSLYRHSFSRSSGFSEERGAYSQGQMGATSINSLSQSVLSNQENISPISSTYSNNNNDIAPNRTTPRDLPVTQYAFSKMDNGESIYDSPNEIGKYLYYSQGSANPNFLGTCGLCSCANVLRLAGVNLTESQVIEYASTTKASDSLFGTLCSVNPFNAHSSGGTRPKDRKEILEHFGISSGLFPVELEKGRATDSTIYSIAKYVSEGRGVIASVHAGILYNGYETENDFHAVTITSVRKNKYGDITGFYIADSNKGTNFYTIETFRNALTGADLNVSYSILR